MNIKNATLSSIAVCCAISWSVPDICGAAAPESLMFVGDFEKNSLEQFDDSRIEHTLKKTCIVSEPVRHGKYALELTLDRKRDGKMRDHRTDFWIRGMSKKFSMEEEYWYGFSSYWPDSWQPDTQNELFVQWVGWRDYGPSVAIYIYGEDYYIKKRWAGGNTDNKGLWRGKVAGDRGKWVDWVFHIRWSTGKDGLVEAWKNGEKIIADQGRNCGSGEFAPYFKFGIYKWPWKETAGKTPSTVTQRTLYVDEIRIGDRRSSPSLVSPPQIVEINEALDHK